MRQIYDVSGPKDGMIYDLVALKYIFGNLNHQQYATKNYFPPSNSSFKIANSSQRPCAAKED